MATACIANIGQKGRHRRLGFGIVLLALGGLAAVALFHGHAQRAWRVGLFLPFWMGALGVFQAVGHT
jgi:hypothetical protein